jgi:hypothetical protein
MPSASGRGTGRRVERNCHPPCNARHSHEAACERLARIVLSLVPDTTDAGEVQAIAVQE